MRRRVRLVVRTGLLAMIAVACARATSERNVLGYASLWIHGVTSAPDSLRLWMESNRRATDVIEEALLGHRRAPSWFDTASAVYWLSDSGRPEYMPTLLRFAGHADFTVATFAIYGLARHADDPVVRARLLELDASAPRDLRSNMAGALVAVNDSSARSLLAVMSRRDLQPYAIEMIERALAGAPTPRGKGRIPCLPSIPPPHTGPCPER